uniref:HTH arsR-type domain-containing protein n=1 Tax=Strongyloides stercoralis TaxID=6248 RepID=A0A0K0EA56_STRER
MEFFTRTKRQSAIFEKTLKQSGFKNQQKDQLEKDSLNNVEKPIKKARRQKTTTKVPEFITTNILSESSIVQKENIKMPIDDYDEYFAKFKADHMNNGNENLENEDRGRPCFTVDNDELRAIVEADLRQTVGKLAEALNVSTATVSRHLKEIGKTKKLDKWIPHELNDYQKNRRFEICSSLILRNKNDSFLD